MLRLENIEQLDKEYLKQCLLFKDNEQEELFETARSVRDNGRFGKQVELRSVIEISNRCRQQCRYCTMGSENKVHYFSMSSEEIYAALTRLANIGRRTFLLQSGENNDSDYIDNVKNGCAKFLLECPDAKIILCLGNLSYEQYVILRETGAQRYILKFETSRPEHYHFCKPKDELCNRIHCIENLFRAGFQVGSGNITGLPEQTLDDLINDIILTTKYPFSMVSSTKFCSNERSEFHNYPNGDINTTLNMLAILRILHPDCLIPSTSSLTLGKKNGQLLGLQAGCNTVTIHDGTADNLKKEYPIYSDQRFTPSEKFCRELVKQAGMTPASYLI